MSMTNNRTKSKSCMRPSKSYVNMKIAPGEFSMRAAMWGGGVFFETPYTLSTSVTLAFKLFFLLFYKRS